MLGAADLHCCRQSTSMPPTDPIGILLLVSGALTSSPLLLFLSPRFGAKALFKVQLVDTAGRLFMRHWGLLAASLGGLLAFAAWHPELRSPVMLAAAVEKAGFAGLIFADWKKPHTAGMHLAALVDTACVLAYVWCLCR